MSWSRSCSTTRSTPPRPPAGHRSSTSTPAPTTGITFVTVTDNGGGITPATVADLCDFTVLVSDKARYRGPARGAQGNALKTLLGIPYALGVDEPVVIESAGVRHELRVSVDGPAMWSSPTRRPPATARWAHR